MTQAPPRTRNSRTFLVAGIAAIGASVCCVGPLVLVALGVSGGWFFTLAALEPYRPLFIGVTVVALALAFRRLYLVPVQCELGSACANPATRRNQRILFWVVAVGLTGLITFPWYASLVLS